MQLSSSRVDHCILHIPQVASCKSRNWSPFQRSKRAFWSCRHTLGRNMCNQRQQGWEHIVVPRWKWVQYGRLRSSQYFAPSLFNCVSFISFSLSLVFFALSLSLPLLCLRCQNTIVVNIDRLNFWWQHTVQSWTTKEHESNSMCNSIQHHNAVWHSCNGLRVRPIRSHLGHMITHMIIDSGTHHWFQSNLFNPTNSPLFRLLLTASWFGVPDSKGL